MEKIKQFVKEKHIMSKLAFCVIFILIYAFLLAFKNVPYIEFVVTEDERVLKENSKLKINYNVDEDSDLWGKNVYIDKNPLYNETDTELIVNFI